MSSALTVRLSYKAWGWFWESLTKSYAQVFFSDNKGFGVALLLLTFIDLYVGIYGLLAVCTALLTANGLGFYESNIRKGFYGFNALLIGVGLGIYFEPGLLLLILVFLSGVLAVLFSVTLEGFLGKYGLPFLSIPFILIFWMIRLTSGHFEALGLSERGVYVLNDLYTLGGGSLIQLYEWVNQLGIPPSLKSYFLSLGAIFFQQTLIAGIIAAVGLLIYSRIAFTLSFLGFYVAYFFYLLLGVSFSEVTFSYVAFNYILVAIALGGYFIIPNRSSYLMVLLIIPLVVLISISLQEVFSLFNLPVHSFPFNVSTLIVLYALKFRVDNRIRLSTIFWQQNSPERNLYSFSNFMKRFGKNSPVPIYLPFFGEWTVTQGHNGEYTHKDDWKYAWDFEIKDEEGSTFRKEGDFAEDYYCFNKNVLAPAKGVVEEVVNEVEDNVIGHRNLENNWGNTIVIKHGEFLYSKLSHLKKGSIPLKPGDAVEKGQVVGKCGNSGNSPYPHLHFQMQATPYVGSATIDYPISDIWIRHEGKEKLMAVSIPPKNALVSSLVPQAELKKAFSFVVGDKLDFETQEGKVSWEVKRDYYLNKYLECEKSGAKAYFKVDDLMLHFTHFEGSRKSLLYHFFLSAFKVSFGFTPNLKIQDSFPIHLIFHPKRIFIQDFLAPIYSYLRADYELNYPKSFRGFSAKPLIMNGEVKKRRLGKLLEVSKFQLVIDQGGLVSFSFERGTQKINASCIRD
ncbi:urea transporter [Algoriphagus sp. AK58]|uniref:urea transporter n=1 Tax=Algoriphagus sp. AK58 TaxID=1406877 RepID=UPI00164F029F|nr:urea transporter [Algoriphagus sp. AK58]MBC6366844.1 peptidase M23 [Algoriphagus sp. AK58]